MRPVLIDTDPGIDDALALLLAWGSPEIRVEAITTVAGNVPVGLATRNVGRLLAARRPHPEPAVAPGAAAPLARPLVTAVHYHGADGLGDVEGSFEVAGAGPGEGSAEPAHGDGAAAVDLIARTAARHGADLTIVMLGPLTNLALALARAGDVLRRVGRVVAMGGAVDVPGNVTPESEFNVHVDPEAVAAVLDAGLPLDLVPLDATRQARLSRTALEGCLAGRPPALADWIRAFTARAFRADAGAMVLHDPLAVGLAVDPSLATWEPVRLRVGPDGSTRRAPGPPNCRIAARVDAARFLAMFAARLCPS